jgi:hypothetical protein
MKGKDAQNGRPGKVVFLYLRTHTAINHCNSVKSLSIYTHCKDTVPKIVNKYSQK